MKVQTIGQVMFSLITATCSIAAAHAITTTITQSRIVGMPKNAQGLKANFSPSNPGNYNGNVTSTFAFQINVIATSDEPVTHIRLIMSGNTASAPDGTSFDYPIDVTFNNGFVGTWSKTIWWDTTHYVNNSNETFEVDAWDNQGNKFTTFSHARVFNRAYAIKNQTVAWSDQQLDSAVNNLQAMAHTVLSSGTDQKPMILARLPAYTVFFADTHGNYDNFTDCIFSKNNADPNDQVTYREIAPAIAKKTSSQPPYNFVMLDACETAGETGNATVYNLSNAFAVSNPGQDQAFLGWHNEMYQSATNAEWTARFWQNMANGNTVQVAVDKATIDGDPEGELVRTVIDSSGPVFPVVQGDTMTKLHGVYGGNGTTWYLVK